MTQEATLPTYTTETDRQATRLREELDALTSDRLLRAIAQGHVGQTSDEVSLAAFQTFVLTKLAALQVATGTGATP